MIPPWQGTNQFTPQAVRCGICGAPTTMTGTKRCNGCWETERHLDEYLRHPAGRANVLRILAGEALKDIPR